MQLLVCGFVVAVDLWFSQLGAYCVACLVLVCLLFGLCFGDVGVLDLRAERGLVGFDLVGLGVFWF